ncbi:UDP-3-O-(3-hydroxymyristoyl)glucosamine N-acyltransferase [Acidovorax soli]|uniref:UDP-3-O-(3-hydroxymyristoyl)glucosamine N-acyltransferase n=1 Tax=Acidovorax TaxID=12916 RepID=UPI0026E92573|nr:UDP-3-O-(3-hydroxymyristoyl)glucosamine N-acyltransferase [Acidovorax soli]MCM2345655.1 UDP-3-O-(3-hydroxymyristoyl)glucosamine N-acyltransferase [Acidovorax soli]
MSLLLGNIVDALGGSLEGGLRETEILRIAPLETAGPGDISFLSHPRYQQQLAASRAACVIVAPAMHELALVRGACIVADNPYAYFARVTQLWRQRHGEAVQAGVHPSAVVDATAVVHPSASVGPLCVVERGAHIGAGTVLKSRVTVGEECHIGARCIVHAGVVIGADGFGFAPENGQWIKIEQLGAVRIGDDVEIGANTCIDRGALQDTVIEDGVKLDNLIQVGHNVHIGKHAAMAGCVGIAGSATIGAHCTVGGGAIVLGHLKLADNVHISAGTVVTRSLNRPGQYTGMFPIDDNARWEKNAATLKQLHSLRERIKALEQALKAA